MEEKKTGLEKAFEALGNRIVELEREKNYERIMKEDSEREVKRLTEENAQLRSKLNAVEEFINTAEEQRWIK